MISRKRAFTTWVNFKMEQKNVKIKNCFVDLFRDKNMKYFVESLTQTDMRKLQSWDNLSAAQQVTRIEWILDELKDLDILKLTFYCEFPALGRGAYDETEWFLWSIIKNDLFRVFECSLSYLETPNNFLTKPYIPTFVDTPEETTSKSRFLKTSEELEAERLKKAEERAAWKSRLRPGQCCIDLINKYLSKTQEGKRLELFSSLEELTDTRVLLTFVNTIFEDIFTPDIILNDKWGVNLALSSLSTILRINSCFDSEDLVMSDGKAISAYLTTVFHRALQFIQCERVLKRLDVIAEKLHVCNKELTEMSTISMSSNESRQKKELLLKVEVLKKEEERLTGAYDVAQFKIWHEEAVAERRRVHSLVAYRLRQRFISEPIKRPIVISNLLDSQYINLSLTNGAAFYTTKLREAVSPTRRLVLYDHELDRFIDDFSGAAAPGEPTVRELLGIPENSMTELCSEDFKDRYTVYYESLTRNRTLKPGQLFLYQLFPGSQLFLQKVYHKRVKVGDLMTVKKLVKFYEGNKSFVDSRDPIVGDTALHIATKHGHFHIVLYLLEHNANFEIKNNKGKTPFFIAAELFDRQICKVLIEWGCDVFTKNSYQKPALELMNNEKFRSFILAHHQYIMENNIKVMQGDMDLLNKVVLNHKYKAVPLSTLRSRCFNGMTCMHVAVRFGAIPIIELLFEMGISVKIRDSIGSTPLHYVYDVLTGQVLIEHGANVNAVDNNLDTPMHYLCCSKAGVVDGEIDIAELLASYGANMCMVNRQGYMPLHYSAIQGRADYIRLLLEQDKDNVLETILTQTTTPSLLYLAVKHRHLKCARWLTGAGHQFIDNEATDLLIDIVKDSTVLRKLRIATVKFLLDNGADANALDNQSKTPVLHMCSCSNDTIELLSLLIEYGGNVNITDNSGKTPLCVAAQHNNIYTAKMLIEQGAQTDLRDKSLKLPFQYLHDYQDWISHNLLTPHCNTVLVQCSLDAERKLVRTISDRIAYNEQRKRHPNQGRQRVQLSHPKKR